MSKVYLSGPIQGLTYKDARYGWRKEFTDMLDPEIVVLSPMRHEGHLAELNDQPIEIGRLPKNMFSRPKMIVAKDYLDIDESTIVVINLLGATKISQGTIAEVGYATAKGKTIIVIREPEGNIHNTPFISEAASAVVGSCWEAAQLVNSLLSEGL